MKKLIIIYVVVALFSSCIKEVDPKYYPDTEKKAVAISFIKFNEDSLKLNLQWSKPLFTEGYPGFRNIENAIVKIKSDKTYNLQWNNNLEQYFYSGSNLNINKGDELKLQISHSDINKELVAYTTIPDEPNYNFKFISRKDIDEYTSEIKIEFEIKDNEDSYYIVYAFAKEDAANYIYQVGEDYLDNKSNNFRILTYNIGSNTNIEKMNFYILKCDDNYYKYHKSLYNYNGIQIFAEPSLIYSNIENGLGVFSSYILVKDSIIIN